MYVQAMGWQLARKDKIDLDCETLHQKQGLYTCPPTTEGQKPFHCCLQMREEPINVRSWLCTHPTAWLLYLMLSAPSGRHTVGRSPMT